MTASNTRETGLLLACTYCLTLLLRVSPPTAGPTAGSAKGAWWSIVEFMMAQASAGGQCSAGMYGVVFKQSARPASDIVK